MSTSYMERRASLMLARTKHAAFPGSTVVIIEFEIWSSPGRGARITARAPVVQSDTARHGLRQLQRFATTHTHDGEATFLAGTDGARLYLGVGALTAPGIAQIPISGVDPARIP